MEFCYEDYFFCRMSTGYERLLYECMIGDATLFRHAEMVEASWSVVQPILDSSRAFGPGNCFDYAAGTWGPQAADELIEGDGRHWHNP